MIVATDLLCGLFGLVLPGYLLAKVLGDRQSALATGFASSIVIMFNVIFWTEMAGSRIVPVRVGAVIFAIVVILAVAWWYRAGAKLSWNASFLDSWRQGRITTLAACSATAALLIGAAVLLRAWLWPFFGFDTPFRWGFLPARMLELETFKFYPPITPDDFRHYFFTDGIPPAVSFAYWWIYGTAGRVEPWLTFWFIGAQYAAITYFTYALATRLGSARAGWFAVAMLVCSAQFTNSILIGQESGLLALALVALLYHVVTGYQEQRWQPFVLAGLAAALGALSREYGCAMLVVGVGTLLWLRGRWQHAAILFVTTTAAAGPWYVRNWVLTGNPFYSNTFFGMPVNAMHAAIMNYYRSQLGFSSWTYEAWRDVFKLLILGATWQVTLGVVGGLAYLRKFGFLAVSIVIVVLLWMYSVPLTSGGPIYSMRVLCAALPIASVLAALWVDERSRTSRWIFTGWWTGFAALSLLALASTLVFPGDIWNPDSWRVAFMSRIESTTWYGELTQLPLPPGARVLADDAYLHAFFYGKGIDVLPVWSPEVAFLTDPSLSGLEARKRLQQAGINWVVAGADLNGAYLAANVPFYRDDHKNWLLRITDKQSFAVYQLLTGGETPSRLIDHPPP